MTLAFLQSSQDFVRALKAQPDPPSPGGPTKIEIAEQAWANSSFYVPSKGEVIADWILTRLLKEKDKETSVNPLFDERYWQLMHSILEPTLGGVIRPATSSWLAQLLNRIPLSPVVVAFLSNPHLSKASETLVFQFASCVALLWPISSHRMNAEALQETFGAFLHCTSYEGLKKIGILLTNSYRNSFSNSSSKKKVHQIFIQKYLSIWVKALSATKAQDLHQAILTAGMDVFFNLEVLRHEQGTKADPAIISRLQATAKQDFPLVHTFLPTLFSNYVQTLNRHRGALFSQGSQSHTRVSLDKLRQTTMTFFSSLLNLVGDSEEASAWNTRLALLDIVDRENLFDPDHSSSSLATKGILQLCLRALEDSYTEKNSEQMSTIIQCLSRATRVDYDLVSPILPKILPKLLQIPISGEALFDFLDPLLSYHTKTRTINDFITLVLSAVSTSIAARESHQAQYQLFSSSSLVHPKFLNSLVKATRHFMTESQCLPTMQHVFTVTRNAWDQMHDTLSTSYRSAKKRKKSTSFADMDIDDPPNDKTLSEDSILQAISYTLVARFASVMLSSLPTQSLSAATLEAVGAALIDFRKDFVQHAISKALKSLKKSDADCLESWGLEITLAANLRLLYALDVSRNLQLPLNEDVKMTGRLTELLERKDEMLPELIVEVFRALLYRLSVHLLSIQEELIEHLVEYLETHFSPSRSRWSGHTHHLSKDESGRSNAALAILFMVVGRWMPQLDHFASKAQLSRFLKVVTNIGLDPEVPEIQTPTELQPKQLLSVVFQSAQFWEFRNIRDALLELISHTTTPLPLNKSPSKASERFVSYNTSISETVPIFRFLLLFPLEYLPWPLIVELTTRAVAGDNTLFCTLLERGVDQQHLMEQLVLLRVFLKRAHAYASSGGLEFGKEEGHQLVLHLLEDAPGLEDDVVGIQETYEKATLDLIEVYLVRLLKVSKKSGPEDMLAVLSCFRKPALGANNHSLLFICFGRLVDILVRDFAATGSVHEDVLLDLDNLYRETSLAESANVITIAKLDFGVEDLRPAIALLSRHHTLLRLGKWLDIKEHSYEPILCANKLTAKAMHALKNSSQEDSRLFQLSVSLFGILLQELEYRAGPEHTQHLEVIVAAYTFLSDSIPAEGVKEMDRHLSTLAKQMKTADYDYLLSFIAEALKASPKEPSSRLQHLVYLASLLLRDHPSHSLVYIQKFATKCLGIFVNTPDFVEGDAALRSKVLQMVIQYCSDQQAALRLQDTSLVFLLLDKYLAHCPASKHDIFTPTDVFHGIIAILTTLIRLRRDLVTLCLPHLGIILQRLICCIKGCRSNLGAKQTSLVMATLPKWIAVSEPLGVDGAKALARLLESLTVKSTVRTISASNQAESHQKAESLSKPFSKHAAYVLKAYIEAMNDPLCIITLDIRKELKPGLFALCGMMSEHSRDALMVSGGFGDGGKAVLKSVWQDWEATRYTGKG